MKSLFSPLFDSEYSESHSAPIFSNSKLTITNSTNIIPEYGHHKPRRDALPRSRGRLPERNMTISDLFLFWVDLSWELLFFFSESYATKSWTGHHVLVNLTGTVLAPFAAGCSHCNIYNVGQKFYNLGPFFLALVLYFGFHWYANTALLWSIQIQLPVTNQCGRLPVLLVGDVFKESKHSFNDHPTTVLDNCTSFHFYSVSCISFFSLLPLMVALRWDAKKRSRKGERERPDTIERAATGKELQLTNRLKSRK